MCTERPVRREGNCQQSLFSRGRESGVTARRVRTSGRVQSLAASVALEVFRLLVGDEELQILKVSFAYSRVSQDRARECRSPADAQ